jgi:O-antigen/teichoic acid export membrane protein
MLLSISVGQILLKQTAELSSDLGALRQFFTKLLKLMTALATAGLLFLWLFGEPILHYLLGPRWKVDRDFITLVALAVFVRACVSPLSTVLITLRRLGLGLTWQVLYFCSALFFMPYVASRINFDRYMLFYALHECFFYGLYLIFIYWAISLGKSGREPLAE